MIIFPKSQSLHITKLCYFCNLKGMIDKKFEIVFLDEAFGYLQNLERKHYEKILFNIRKAQINADPRLFKKLRSEIWEFRTFFEGRQHRLLAFWDKTVKNRLVVATHGFLKKQSKIPAKQIDRALSIRNQYFKNQDKINRI
jgi:phage-related protein